MDLNASSVIIWFLTVSIVSIFSIYKYFTRHNDYWKKRGIPYEKPYPFIGNLKFVMTKSISEFFHLIKDKYKCDYVGIFLAWQPALVIQSPEMARDILVKDHEYFQDRSLYAGYSDPLGSLNLFTVKNPIWTEMRNQLSPLFTSSRLKSVTELMNTNALQLVDKIRRDCVEKQKNLELKELFHMYTSETVASTVFGIKSSILKDEPSPLWNITCNMLKWSWNRGLEFIMIFLVPDLAATLRLKFFSHAATEYVKKLFWDVAGQRKLTDTSNEKDLLNHLLRLKENMKLPADADTELADNLMLAQAAVFILGSVETSSSTLTYCVHELAYHPEKQEKLYNELKEAFEHSGQEVLDYDALMKLNYLSSCIYETLRKYVPVPYLDRKCNMKYKLNDDVTIEKGTPVFVNVLALHYNEKYFPEPEQWRPERMTSVLSDSDCLNYTYLPFGVGPRFCIGKRYGMMQVRAALSQVIWKYKVEPKTGKYKLVDDPYSVLLSPNNSGTLNFIPRHN